MSKQTNPLDQIESLCDEYGAQVSIARANKIWIGVVQMPDGRQAQHQSPLNQAQLFDDLLHSIKRMVSEVSSDD